MQLEPGGLGTPTKFTQRSSALESWNAAGGTVAAVGVSVRSQAAARYAIAGKVRIAAILRSVCIGLLLEAPREHATDGDGTPKQGKARAVRDGSTRAEGAAFGTGESGAGARPMARTPWRRHQRSGEQVATFRTAGTVSRKCRTA